MKNYHKNIDRTGKNNPNYNNGYFYEIIDPNGKIGYTNQLVIFCKINNLSRSALCRIMANRQKYDKGWTIQKIT